MHVHKDSKALDPPRPRNPPRPQSWADAYGEAVNLAAKLEKHNKVEATRALTTAGTFALASAQGWVAGGCAKPKAQRSIAGAGEPLDLVAIG